MLLLNNKMVSIYNRLNLIEEELDESLLSLVESGFKKINECFFLNSLYADNVHHKEADFIDQTGFESFINSFHVDDYVKKDYMTQSFLFIFQLFRKWRSLGSEQVVKAYISETDYGANIKFHIIREDEFLIEEKDIDSNDKAVAVSTSSIGL